MKTTLMQRSAGALLPVSAGEWCLVAPTAAPVQGTGVSAAVRMRHDADALGTGATAADGFASVVDTLDAVVLPTAADAAPPPRGAPV